MNSPSQSQTKIGRQKKKHFYMDLSLWSLILANLIVVVWAVTEDWSLATLLWVYWCQSVSIGIFWYFKILKLKDFSTNGVLDGGEPVQPTKQTKLEMARFFLIHFGFFHFIYLIFLFAAFRPPKVTPILIMAVVFFFYQYFSFVYNRKWETKGKPNIGKLFIFPYARVIPMHLTIIFGGFLASHYGTKLTLQVFILLKTMADVIMHISERRGFCDKPKSKDK